ncbi:chemotaxis protein CheD [Geomesophilobacter sediminis]|uniref:Probable chemoreceptor glutamine deamidase CheD n=1 Tax=Geomesophilobacter sediminis TaxID=2798584 RepID=A0A8J7JE78_9BACT|nr:chemotaxis protein CheD [Geomesophilobacter sediminis]MBJ6725783.1 chemotaxis protein CheD [Geomesophilobacter sediminis]
MKPTTPKLRARKKAHACSGTEVSKHLKSGLPLFYLKAGELIFSRDAALVSTVLGSCLSLIIYSNEPRLWSICHVLLPTGKLEEGFKYVDSTFDYMVRTVEEYGIRLSSCEVKLFGGANSLMTSGSGSAKSVGEKNIALALEKLKSYGVKPAAIDVGGPSGRKLFFNTRNGEVFVRKIGTANYRPPTP